jgi:diguanylate cyclase (GGDEF)-like protein
MIPRNFIRSYNAKLNLENNKPLEVINILSPYLKEVTATRYPRLIVEVYTLLAEAYWLQENLEQAKEFALKSTEIGQNINTTQAVVAAYKLLYKIAKKQSNHQETALQYHEIYAELDKAYIDETKAKYLAYQLAVHKELEQKNKIKFLNKKNELLIVEQALIKANADNTRFILLILVIVISILLVWGSRLLQAHKRIKQLAEYDSLTGIYNRGHFTQIANSALEYCKSANQELSIIMFDLDYFKKVNDDYGHACGDWALKNVIYACKAIGRQNDIFARLGGEEFCILLTSCDKDSAYQRAETYRQAIANITTKESGFDFTITASFGVTDTKTSGYDFDQILADADSAAYASKYAGRNQVTIFQSKEEKDKNKKKDEEAMQLDSSRNPF